jgi:two-component system OmpR family response regulator
MGRKMRFAVVEDNETLANGIAHQLRDQGHSVDVLHDGAEALTFLRQDGADLVILDVNLPSLNGLELLRNLRASGSAIPIILLTARGEVHDRVSGLDAGADDYMTELDARIRALMRRKPVAGSNAIMFHGLTFDRAARKLSCNGTDIALTMRELAVFECLFERANTIVSKAQIADHLYGIGAEIEERVVEVYVSRVRKKIGQSDATIKSARGLGYMLGGSA